MAYSTIVYGGVTLNVLNIDKNQVPGTIKQTFGSEVIEIPIPGKAKEWRISIQGHIVGASKDTTRSDLEALNDGKAHDYSDGLISAQMVIPNGGLSFNDVGGRDATFYEFNLSLIQFNQ